MKIIIFIICCLFTSPTWASEPSDKQKVIIEILEVTHIGSLMAQLQVRMQKIMPQVLHNFRENLKNKLKRRQRNDS